MSLVHHVTMSLVHHVTMSLVHCHSIMRSATARAEPVKSRSRHTVLLPKLTHCASTQPGWL